MHTYWYLATFREAALLLSKYFFRKSNTFLLIAKVFPPKIATRGDRLLCPHCVRLSTTDDSRVTKFIYPETFISDSVFVTSVWHIVSTASVNQLSCFWWSSGDKLYFLDPHTQQSFVDLSATVDDMSYHCRHPSSVDISQLDPSVAMVNKTDCFICGFFGNIFVVIILVICCVCVFLCFNYKTTDYSLLSCRFDGI